MIIPLAHEDMRARRFPVVTLAIALLCFVVHVGVSMANTRAEARARDIFRRAAVVAEYPGVATCATLTDLGFRARSRARAPEGVDAPTAQAELDALCSEMADLLANIPVRRFGYTPGAGRPLTLITHMFVHGGWLHLAFNLWFLALTGMNLEDRWGRWVFLPFYLVAGVVAALVHGAVTPAGAGPMVGASGAIAGAMGAFLVGFARTRIRLGVWLLIRFVTFHAPAYVMLPLWGITELLDGVMFGSRDGVAHWAHVGGFAFGVVFAGALRLSGFERRLDAAVELTVTTLQDPRIARAAELVDAGRAAEAFPLLDALAREQPSNLDAQLEALRAARAAKDRPREIHAFRRLVELYLDRGEEPVAADLFDEMRSLGAAHELPRATGLRIGGGLFARGDLRRARLAYEAACHEGVVDAVAVRATLTRAKIAAALKLDAEARDLLAQVKTSAYATPELLRIADEELVALAPPAIDIELA